MGQGDIVLAQFSRLAIRTQQTGSRDIGIVFQNYAIFPHMHVYDNIAFGLRMRKQSEDEIGRKVKAALEQVEMLGYERRYQRELLGFLMRFTGSRASAEDVFQEAFLQVHLAAPSFDPSRAFRPWLYTIAASATTATSSSSISTISADC